MSVVSYLLRKLMYYWLESSLTYSGKQWKVLYVSPSGSVSWKDGTCRKCSVWRSLKINSVYSILKLILIIFLHPVFLQLLSLLCKGQSDCLFSVMEVSWCHFGRFIFWLLYLVPYQFCLGINIHLGSWENIDEVSHDAEMGWGVGREQWRAV